MTTLSCSSFPPSHPHNPPPPPPPPPLPTTPDTDDGDSDDRTRVGTKLKAGEDFKGEEVEEEDGLSGGERDGGGDRAEDRTESGT